MSAVALVLGDPVSDLALGEAGVGLLLASVGVGHLRRVHHPFRHAVARYWALTPPSVSVASSCQLLLAPRQLGVVLLQLLTHVGHCGVAYLHRVPVDHLPQLMPYWKARVQEVQELLADVGGYRLREGWVEPRHLPCPCPPGARRGCRWCIVEGQLVVVASLVQGLLVGRHHRQEFLLAAGEPAEALVHCLGNVPEDGGWVVRECVDVKEVGVGFGIWSEGFCRQVQGKIKKVDDFFVHLTDHFQTIVLEHLLDLLPQSQSVIDIGRL